MSKYKNQVEYFYIEVKSKKDYKKFRTQDIDEKVGIKQVTGQREDGIWETVKWLVSKEIAHIADGSLIADSENAKELFEKLVVVPIHIQGNLFEAKA